MRAHQPVGLARPMLHVSAPAKVNLYLHVVGRRADGYHLLDSLFVFADIADVVHAVAAHEVSLRVVGQFADQVGATDGNLVLKSALALRGLADALDWWSPDHMDEPRGVALTLDKTLPVAAGIGGGSADAAATLRLLSRLWRLDRAAGPLSTEDGLNRLRELALSLGADVPACLDARPVFVSGIGERLDPAPGLPPVWIVLVNPLCPCPTPAVFKARQGAFSEPVERPPLWADMNGLVDHLSTTGNDLEPPAQALVPEIGLIIDALRSHAFCRLARMSGSGATCFGLFSDAASALASAEAIGMANPTWWVKAARVLDGPPAIEILPAAGYGPEGQAG